jgi:hypothetical protein
MDQNTNAFRRFRIVLFRTESLIEYAGSGIAQEVTKLNGLLHQFKDVKERAYERDLKFSPKIELLQSGNKVNITMDDRSAYLFKRSLEFFYSNTEELHNHSFAIYLVYVWGAFETYITMIFEEMFKKRPEMLRSNEIITYKEIIENHDKILKYLINKELEKIGHFSLEKYLSYFENKINLKFQDEDVNRLQKIYLIRNIIAHNTGIVPQRLEEKLPQGVSLKNSELIITKKFLEEEIKSIRKIVSEIEEFVIKKFPDLLN